MALLVENWREVGPNAAENGRALPRLVAGADVHRAIASLRPEDLFGRPGPTSVRDVGGWRIDRQDAPAGFTNLSVQRNGVGWPSTVASVFLPARLNIAPGRDGPGGQPFVARVRERERAVRRGLEESWASHTVDQKGGRAWIVRKAVAGDFSNG